MKPAAPASSLAEPVTSAKRSKAKRRQPINHSLACDKTWLLADAKSSSGHCHEIDLLLYIFCKSWHEQRIEHMTKATAKLSARPLPECHRQVRQELSLAVKMLADM